MDKIVIALAWPCAGVLLLIMALVAFAVLYKWQSDLDHSKPVPWASEEVHRAYRKRANWFAVVVVALGALAVGGLMIVALGGY
jgi:hypothetical protein